MIAEYMVCLVETVHRSCSNTNTASKRTDTKFQMTHITYDIDQVCPKRFLCLWYGRHKLSNYHVARLALSLNGLKRAST
jgi:hypothetical protein